MEFHEKLCVFFKENGIQKKWFAEKMGMPNQQFSQVCAGYAKLPKKFWSKVIEMTGGYITLTDIMTDFLSGVKFLEVRNTKHVEKCEVVIHFDLVREENS